MRTELYWMGGPGPGRLTIVPRPRGGDWLDDEVRSWRSAGVDVVVSALEADEVEELDLAEEQVICDAHGIEFAAFPIPDRGVPSSARATAELARRLEGCLAAGKNVAIHCRQGVGRSALLAACVLALSGMESGAAFAQIEAARGCPVPETSEQREWVDRFAPTVFQRV